MCRWVVLFRYVKKPYRSSGEICCRLRSDASSGGITAVEFQVDSEFRLTSILLLALKITNLIFFLPRTTNNIAPAA